MGGKEDSHSTLVGSVMAKCTSIVAMQFFSSFGQIWLFIILTSILISSIELTKYETIEGTVYEVTEGENCFRECDPHIFKICEFNFSASWWHTLNADCNNCPKNLKDCFNVNCISADGTKRLVQVINKQLPGPSIQVCENDVIRVKVKNNLQHGTGLTIHWHGMSQAGSQFNDGTPYITQCYIDYKSSFQYEFKAQPAGTHIWHSHGGLQIGDGLYGALIVRKPSQLEKNSYLYDKDLADHYILVQTFRDIPEEAVYQTLMAINDLLDPVSLLINGRAQRIEYDGHYTPLTTYKVIQGNRYRFRLINIGPSDCQTFVSFDYHKMTVIGTDTGEIYPLIVDSSSLAPGQRFDVVIEADKDIANYYITVKGGVLCDGMETKGILSYDGAGNAFPIETPQLPNRPLLLNYLGQKQREEYETIMFSNLVSLDYDPFLREDPDIVLYFNLKNTDVQGLEVGNPRRSLANSISFLEPTKPLWSINQIDLEKESCTMESLMEENINCTEILCECTHFYHIPLESNVEMVLIAYTPGGLGGNHPMHMHGNSVKVVSMGSFDEDVSIIDFKKMDKEGKFYRNLINPPETDTVGIPSLGYAIVRFSAKNPGWWLFHCHVDIHIQWGMTIAFEIGDKQDFPLPPAGYPTCSGWTGKS